MLRGAQLAQVHSLRGEISALILLVSDALKSSFLLISDPIR